MFQVIKKEGNARRGVFTCPHGTVQTPVFMNVGTQGAIKGALSAADLEKIGTQVELSNTYHLHLRPGDEVVKKLGGLHKFMTWDGPILTDSGGFQVFSLAGLRKIKEEGVHFASHLDGRKIFMGPEESMRIQANLGSDIAMAFDECVENPATYQPLFMIVSAIMFVSIGILFLTIKEPKLTAENQALEAAHPEWNLAIEDSTGHEVLPAPVKRSLGFLLASIALWFIGYNGVTTWFTTYVSEVMGQGLGGASTCLLIATAGAIVSYIPVGQIASKIGRKKTILGGVILLAVCFALGYVLTTAYQSINVIMFVVFALVGLAWAAINVNSLPMVVEMCRDSDIGKFTGYYYTASMAAQVVTPVVAGTLMRHIDYRVLFPYAAFFVALSGVTMCFVRHGDAKAEGKRGLEAFEEMDD